MTPAFIEPGWHLPGVTALATTRAGGSSAAPFASFNLGDHVGDDARAVAANRRALLAALPAGSVIQWLQQVHGKRVVRAGEGDCPEAGCPEADACWSDQPGMACAVMTADCLPVLLAAEDGQVVAAAHAGWRGLLAGVLEATVAAMGVDPMRLLAWLGPAIGPAAFAVGPEVREAFVERDPVGSAFMPAAQPGKYLANLYQLARYRLAQAGVNRIHGGDRCTYSEADQFFSYRRDGKTGRMAAVIVVNPQ
ncbi:peptidoglycan editing factor PgeF [Seongchinamella sediminis]|uniref:Purine nucleoside phosphorylase n=1 Tax=Seongchinamella sediminis TaxID=2283635 RepID=A0A3L7DWB7_9GAMM|nr:peptidoglycan editing factor PgeF [Seongchinamella sediminis]RLQ21426.1 peptidoglycan editing factor PgeF [Seongchinamella sediminis]